jgi:hypothetical protein
LRADVLERLYQDTTVDTEIFATLFLLLKESRAMLQRSQDVYAGQEYANLFKRFFQDDKPKYRAYLAILATCGALSDDISERSSNQDAESKRMREFLGKIRQLLQGSAVDFQRSYLLAFQVLAELAIDASPGGSDEQIAQTMYNKFSKSTFKSLYMKLRMRLDAQRSFEGLTKSPPQK